MFPNCPRRGSQPEFGNPALLSCPVPHVDCVPGPPATRVTEGLSFPSCLITFWGPYFRRHTARHEADWDKKEGRLGLNPELPLLSPGLPGNLGEGVVWTGLLGESRFGRRLRKGVREGGPLRHSCDHTGSAPAASASGTSQGRAASSKATPWPPHLLARCEQVACLCMSPPTYSLIR